MDIAILVYIYFKIKVVFCARLGTLRKTSIFSGLGGVNLFELLILYIRDNLILKFMSIAY